jgi:methylated-DNA-[protein]-cysteine S-methyltransferase
MDKISCVRLLSTPIGTVRICGDKQVVTAVEFDDKYEEYEIIGELTAPVEACLNQLREYFAGSRKKFDVPLHLEGTPFQKTVWNALQKIPFAKRVSYKEVAEMIGNPQGQRAVGLANNHNPIAIVVPCHRVLGANGKLVGYAGGLWRKSWLLEHEAKVMGQNLFV